MKVLITGGCGFLGSNLASAYLADEAEIVVVDALLRQGSSTNLKWLEQQAGNRQFYFYQADIADAQAVNALFLRHSPFDYVCHLAGQVAMTSSLQDPRRDIETNVMGTFNILEAVRNHSPNALIAYSSSNKVYGDLDWISKEETETRFTLPDFPNGFDESLPLDFSTPYGCSKGAADQYVRDWARVFGLRTVVFRHSTIYGGRQFSSFNQGWIGWFCQQALSQLEQASNGVQVDPFTIAGSGKQVRDILDAKDAVKLYKAAFHHRENLYGEIFNIGGGIANSLSLLELFRTISKFLDDFELCYVKQDRRASDQDFFVASISKAQQMLGWTPSISIHEGILNALNWCRDSHLKHQNL